MRDRAGIGPADGKPGPSSTSTPSLVGTVVALGAGAVGAGALLGAGAWAALLHQGRVAARMIESAALEAAAGQGTLPAGAGLAAEVVPPCADGVYLPDGSGPAVGAGADLGGLRLAMIGDSTSVGYGCGCAAEVPGAVLARGAAAALDRPVRLVSFGVVGSGAADLAGQVDAVLAHAAHVAVVVTGANDITGRTQPQRCAALLGAAVGRLRAAGTSVVVGTCPDLGVVAPIPQPLRAVVGARSRRLAALQANAAAAAGARVVRIGTLVSPEFRGRAELFSADGFHPSGLGYAKAAAALLPAVLAAARGGEAPSGSPAADLPEVG